MKRVLVSGAYGFLGRHTVRELRSRGWEVIPIARSPVGSDAFVVDFADPAFFHKLWGLDSCAAIVHLAAKVDWGSELNHSIYRANVHSTSCLALLAQEWGAHMVFSSTATVCGTHTALINATSPVEPDTPYGKSKWLSEQLVNAAAIPATILRIGGIFGHRGPNHLGLNRVIASALAGEVPKITGRGCARRNYIYVKDAACIIALALERGIFGTHFVAGSETLSVAQWLKAVCDELLPGRAPLSVDGPEANDQIVTPSVAFPETQTVAHAMADINVSARL